MQNLIRKLQRHKSKNVQNIDRTNVWWKVATWGGVGLLPAGGTWGSLAALPFAFVLLFCGGIFLLLVGTVAVTYWGIQAANWFEKKSQTHDASDIVVDEVAGQWLTCLGIPVVAYVTDNTWYGTWDMWFWAFVLFRFFDIAKPWPVSWIDDKIGGGAGVMYDDIAAGVYALAALVIGYMLWL